MILDIYSIYDKKAELYARPFFLQNTPVAIRALTDNIDADTAMAKHADDYACYLIGSFDESVGLISTPDIPQLITEMRAIKDLADEAKIDPRQMQIPQTADV